MRRSVSSQAIDLRRGYDGPASIVQEALKEEPLSGCLFLLVIKRVNRIKLFYWDRGRYAIWMKRVESGGFELPVRGFVQCEADRVRAVSLIL